MFQLITRSPVATASGAVVGSRPESGGALDNIDVFDPPDNLVRAVGCLADRAAY
jgi:hypothetical protein